MLSTKAIKELEPKNARYNKGCGTGNGLIIEIQSKRQGGTKSFVGRTRFRGKQIGVYLGGFGEGISQFKSTRKANEEWIKRLEWSYKNQKNPKEFNKKELFKTKTIGDAVEAYLKKKSHEVKPTSLREYSRKLHNFVLTKIDPATPLKELEWDNDVLGRQEI